MDVRFDWKWGVIGKYNIIWDKVCSDIKKEFDSKTFYNEKLLKTRIKTYSDETTNFHEKEMPRAGS